MLNYDEVLGEIERLAKRLHERAIMGRDGVRWSSSSEDPSAVDLATVQLSDLDSFTFIQLVAELEELYRIRLLNNIADFGGMSYADLAEVVVSHACGDT